MNANTRKSLPAFAFAVGVLVLMWAAEVAAQDAGEMATSILSRVKMSGGICSVPRCGDGALAVEIAKSTDLLVHAMDTNADWIARARKRADDAKLLGTQVIIEKGSPEHLPYADNTVDLIVLVDLYPADLRSVDLSEYLRALRPGGQAIIGQTPEAGRGKPRVSLDQVKEWVATTGLDDVRLSETDKGVWAEFTKPPLEGVDDWGHWFHGPDNNPASSDTVIKAPFMTQWLGLPYYVTMPTITTASAGRVFVATGHIAHHMREVPTLNLLTARNGYNGRVLWTRQLPEGYLVHRSAFIATADTFYMIDGAGCLMLDSETGEEKGRVQIEGIEGSWNWMAMQDGVLYVQASDEPSPAVTTKVASQRDHWSWGELSPGYYTDRVPWGFGAHIAAYDMKTKTMLWAHSEAKPIDSRAIGLAGGRLFYYAPDSRIGCLDAKTGEVVWTNSDADLLATLEERGKGLTSTPGFKSNCILLCTDDVLFFEAQTRQHVLAVSAEDGHLLWTRPKQRNNPTLLYVDGRLIASHENTGTMALDPLTGELKQQLGFNKVNCTRMTATPHALYCRGEGLGMYDLAEGVYRIDGSVRPGCNDGALPANGLLYVGPWCCDCNLSLIGTVTLGPAGGFDATEVAPDRLEVGEGDIGSVDPLEVTGLDWPTYRANTRRTAASEAEVPAQVQRAWLYTPDQSVEITAPVSAGGLVFVGRHDGKVVCLDAGTGTPAWEFITAGPIRQAATIWDGRAYVGSGDGYIYCLEAKTGRLLWRFRAAPVERRIMVYGALCSTWPVNSGVLVSDGVAYATAGIIDRDGTYVVALNAETGELVWENTTSGHLDEDLRKGVSAQGNIAIAHGKLWLAAGNQVSPAAFDLETGECVTWLQPRGRPSAPRGAEIGVWMDDHIVHGGRLLYSDHTKVISPGQISFVPLDEEGNIKYPAMTPIQRSSIPPAWNDEVLVAMTQRYNQLVCWDNDLLLKAFEVRRMEEQLRNEAAQRNPDQNARRQKFWQTNPILDNLFRHTGKWGPLDRETMSVILGANKVVSVSGPAPWQREEAKGTWTVLGYELADGKIAWWYGVASEPLADGLCIDRDGRVIVALDNGEIHCLKETPAAAEAG